MHSGLFVESRVEAVLCSLQVNLHLVQSSYSNQLFVPSADVVLSEHLCTSNVPHHCAHHKPQVMLQCIFSVTFMEKAPPLLISFCHYSSEATPSGHLANYCQCSSILPMLLPENECQAKVYTLPLYK